jgi:hypothetical protein
MNDGIATTGDVIDTIIQIRSNLAFANQNRHPNKVQTEPSGLWGYLLGQLRQIDMSGGMNHAKDGRFTCHAVIRVKMQMCIAVTREPAA